MEKLDDSELVPIQHEQLIQAISKLDKTQHIKVPMHNGPTLNSEYNLIKSKNKANISNVVDFEDTAHHVQISKKIKKSLDVSKVLPKPLEKPQAERNKRSTVYEQTKENVGRWDSVVARNRTVDFVTFPLKPAINKLQKTSEFLSKLELKSNIEKELDEVDPPPLVEEEDEDEMQTYQEMLLHRQTIAKFRARQSYKEAKAKQQNKIKSRNYHKILKKERLKQQIKEFEELQKKNPEEALKKLEALEKARALERHTLRHKNTGKWAKSKLMRAKYDKQVRQQLAEQIAISKSLTKKTRKDDSSDEEINTDEHIPDHLTQDPKNSWLKLARGELHTDAKFDNEFKQHVKDKMYKRPDMSVGETDNTNASDSGIENQDKLSSEKSAKILVTHNEKSTSNKKQSNKVTSNKLTATATWIVEPVVENRRSISKRKTIQSEDVSSVFESLEKNVAKKVDKKLKKLKKDFERLENTRCETKSEQKKIDENQEYGVEYLKFNNQRKKPIIDESLSEINSKQLPDQPVQSVNNAKPPTAASEIVLTTTKQNTDALLDTSTYVKTKPKYLNSILPGDSNELDQLDDDQIVPTVDMEEIFEEDDVVASFRQEKEDEINKNKPSDIDLNLPGWGSWGGKGIKPKKRRRNRFILKAPPTFPRRDENKGDIIIKEYKDPKLTLHKVADVPFPFTSVSEYEASIRVPLGNTFIPERAHQKLIKPSVITKAGNIIEPMDEDELLVKRNLTYTNKNVIKLLCKK